MSYDASRANKKFLIVQEKSCDRVRSFLPPYKKEKVKVRKLFHLNRRLVRLIKSLSNFIKAVSSNT
jgi:hypothetical protein